MAAVESEPSPDSPRDGVHRVAARGFDAAAQAYDRSRPSYPPDAVGWLCDRLDVAPGRTVVDLAAGTGKLTALLVDRRARLLAVEPVAGMRAVLRARLPTVPVLAGTAERLPLADGCVDAVTVAQAFHWFDADVAMARLACVVRPGGALGLVWNARDRSVDWVDQVWSVMDRVEHDAPWRDHQDGSRSPQDARRWTETTLDHAPGWTPFEHATFQHTQLSSAEGVVERIASVSHVAALPPLERAAVLDEIRGILAGHPDTRDAAELGVGYRVDAMVSRRR
jgi:SAM-dependent methyltransferase